jgi:3-hydroxy-3-methylglutaryl CoA synthase
MIGISAVGGYIPRRRLSRRAIVDAHGWTRPAGREPAQSERAICNWDEDPITMAVEAARSCLGDRSRDDIGALYFASTSAPFEDRQNSAVVAQALLLRDVEAMDIGCSMRAGTSALIAAAAAVKMADRPVLVIASEQRRAAPGSALELSCGHGAAALLLEPYPGIARLVGYHSRSVDFVDHFRSRGSEFDHAWEERWVREEGYLKLVPGVIAAALKKARLAAADVAQVCFPCTLPRIPENILEQLGIGRTKLCDNLHSGCGDTGASHALILLAHALEQAKPGDHVVAVSFGQGCDALVFQATDALETWRPSAITATLARRCTETNYQRYLAVNEFTRMDRGMRADVSSATPLSALYRKRDMLYGLVGGRCRTCGTAQFPRSRICVNPDCGQIDTQDDQPFADLAARIVSWSADYLTHTPEPPAYYGLLQFDRSGRLMADFTDIDGELHIGTPMRMMFRVKERSAQHGFVRYFWKAAPITARAA